MTNYELKTCPERSRMDYEQTPPSPLCRRRGGTSPPPQAGGRKGDFSQF